MERRCLLDGVQTHQPEASLMLAALKAAEDTLPLRWLTFLVAVIASYLVGDLTFMMVLVEATSSSPSLERVVELDHWGRLLSGIAVGLLVLHFLLARPRLRRRLALVVLAFVLTVAMVFHVLAFAVQRVVESSTAEDRVEAAFCVVAQRGIARAEMVIRGMTDDETPSTHKPCGGGTHIPRAGIDRVLGAKRDDATAAPHGSIRPNTVSSRNSWRCDPFTACGHAWLRRVRATGRVRQQAPPRNGSVARCQRIQAARSPGASFPIQ